ncbi:hypothetical protein [Halomonas salina]|uniref:hypothetical protein n=1 Tax=Halomonas salina TaxID=42565 RepID=UPI001F29095C|nr:hypothetical protein [Halomonas salina]
MGSVLATYLEAAFQEADDIYWMPTTPPFQEKRKAEERLHLMRSVINHNSRLVVSGSVMSWGEEVEDGFDAIIFLTAPTQTRLERITQRDLQRYGSVDPGFLEWAAQYDAGVMTGRSLGRHEKWLAERPCLTLRMESTEDPDSLAHRACALLGIAQW